MIQGATTLWDFTLVRPRASSGLNGSGVELRFVDYRGRRVLYRAHVPILNVQYGSGGAAVGCGPTYRDWQNAETCFQATGTDPVGPGFRVCSAPPQTILESGVDGGNFRGVALWYDGWELRLVSQLQAGWYRYISDWRLRNDGSIGPRFGFAATANPCTCNVHTHHAYWRLDFDIGTAGITSSRSTTIRQSSGTRIGTPRSSRSDAPATLRTNATGSSGIEGPFTDTPSSRVSTMARPIATASVICGSFAIAGPSLMMARVLRPILHRPARGSTTLLPVSRLKVRTWCCGTPVISCTTKRTPIRLATSSDPSFVRLTGRPSDEGRYRPQGSTRQSEPDDACVKARGCQKLESAPTASPKREAGNRVWGYRDWAATDLDALTGCLSASAIQHPRVKGCLLLSTARLTSRLSFAHPNRVGWTDGNRSQNTCLRQRRRMTERN